MKNTKDKKIRKLVQVMQHLIILSARKRTKDKMRDFPGGPVVKTSLSNAGGAGSIPGRGAKIPHASRPETKT